MVNDITYRVKEKHNTHLHKTQTTLQNGDWHQCVHWDQRYEAVCALSRINYLEELTDVELF